MRLKANRTSLIRRSFPSYSVAVDL